MNKHILIADSDKGNLDYLSDNLNSEGYSVIGTGLGKTALEQAKQSPDLLMLDIFLPDMNGWDVIRRLRQENSTSSIPIIAMSSKESDADEIISLEIGADDYLIKPISTPKLLARIRVLFRQQNKFDSNEDTKEIISAGGLEINTRNYTVKHNNSDLIFPRKEFEILTMLVRYPQKVFSRKDISFAVWGSADHTANRTIDVHIGRIRKKLGNHPESIDTVPGIGYKFHL